MMRDAQDLLERLQVRVMPERLVWMLMLWTKSCADMPIAPNGSQPQEAAVLTGNGSE